MFLRCQVTLNTVSALPKDQIVNTYHFNSDTSDPGNFDAILLRMSQLYGQLDSYMSTIMTGVATVRIYNLEDPEPRTPVFVNNIGFNPDGGPTMPADVAICCSYQAVQQSGESPRRRRGRIFFGHPNDSCRGPLVGSDITIHPNALVGISTPFDALAAEDDPRWAVFSPTTAGPPLGPNGAYTEAQLNPAFNDVTNGWIDNRFDTQRRRGGTPTARQTWTR